MQAKTVLWVAAITTLLLIGCQTAYAIVPTGIAAGPLCYTDCSQVSGTTLLDMSGNGHNLTITGTIPRSQASSGAYYLDLPGTSGNYIDGSTFATMANWTVIAYYTPQLAGLTADKVVVGFDYGSGMDAGPVFIQYNAGAYRAGDFAKSVYDTSAWADGSPRMTTVTGNSTGISVWLNGSRKTYNNNAASTLGGKLDLGCIYDHTTGYALKGQIWAIAIWNRTLNDTEIITTYNTLDTHVLRGDPTPTPTPIPTPIPGSGHVFGDSIDAGQGLTPYPALSNNNSSMSAYHWVDYAVGGENVAQISARLYPDLQTNRSQWYSVDGGINDVRSGSYTADQIWHAIKTEYDAVINNSSLLVACTLTYTNQTDSAGADRIDYINQHIRWYVQNHSTNATYADFNSATKNQTGRIMNPSLTTDGLHPNDAGQSALEHAFSTSILLLGQTPPEPTPTPTPTPTATPTPTPTATPTPTPTPTPTAAPAGAGAITVRFGNLSGLLSGQYYQILGGANMSTVATFAPGEDNSTITLQDQSSYMVITTTNSNNTLINNPIEALEIDLGLAPTVIAYIPYLLGITLIIGLLSYALWRQWI